MLTTSLAYANEYIGATSRLVITPLTDRCCCTLMGAMRENLGGAPEGPAGTGKTETVKDLSKAVAVKTLVFNCSEALDYRAMGKLLRGVASVGAWSCFDEFNRIEVEVLSVIAQQILTIQSAKRAGTLTFDFEGEMVPLRRSCNIFITMNPGYVGRAELPDNLKALFRPVAMMAPDYEAIVQIRLYSVGFLQARAMAKKIVAAYKLCSEQLSVQSHYDYGMRAVVAALTIAGRLKQQFPDEREEVLILNAIYDANLPKFLPDDIQLFKWIVADLFPNSAASPKKDHYDSLVEAVKEAMMRLGLQATEKFIEKIIQLYETINSRHGLMLIGNSLAGKSTLYKTLALSLNLAAAKKLNHVPVEYHVINPKAVPLAHLYGSLDRLSQEFSEGILTRVFRECAASEDRRQWVVLDGPVDTHWVESMNTVLDDNRTLCLANGDTICMGEKMNMLFEVDELSRASPATVSRCGMICMQEDVAEWWCLVKSWTGKLGNAAVAKRLEMLFDGLVEKVCNKAKEVERLAKMSKRHLIINLVRMLDGLLKSLGSVEKCEEIAEMYFMYALVNCIECNASEQGCKEMSTFLRSLANGAIPLERFDEKHFKLSKAAQLPESSAPLHSYCIEDFRWKLWREQLEIQEQHFEDGAKYHQIMVQTADTLRFSWLLHFMLSNQYPALALGPTGTGKTLCVNSFMKSLARNKYATLSISLSSQSASSQLQESFESRLELRKRGIFAPRYPKKLLAFVDDLNMPLPDQYGTQPPIEFLRQVFVTRGWYSADKDRKLKRIEDVVIFGAMTVGRRNKITERLLRYFGMVAFNGFDVGNLNRIFGSLMKWHVRSEKLSFDLVKPLSNVVAAIVDVYTFVCDKMLPTPEKHHYLFNMRDISRVVQGIQMANLKSIASRKLIRLFLHETSRVFMDRLITSQDKQLLFLHLQATLHSRFHENLSAVLSEVVPGDLKPDLMQTHTILKHVVFTDIMSGGVSTHERSYEEVQLGESLHERAKGWLEECNRSSRTPLNLVMFEYAVEHLLRVCRVLRMPRGHGLLVGLAGSGRQSLTKLAAFICDFALFTIEVTKNYNKEMWHEDLKKALRAAGTEEKKLAFLLPDTQTKSDFILEDVNSLLNVGDVFNLWTREDKLEIAHSITSKHPSIAHYTKEQLYDFFVERVGGNFHMVLTMSWAGTRLRRSMRDFPSLASSCAVDWFDKWPESALRAAAVRFLGEGELSQEALARAGEVCTAVHAEVEEMSERLLREDGRRNYVTPTVYIELVQSYTKLLKSQKQLLTKTKEGYIKGVEKMKFATEEIEVKQRELEEKSPHLEEMGKKVAELIAKVNVQINEVVGPKKKFVMEEEQLAGQQAQEAEQLLADCNQELAKFTPKLREAQSKMDALTAKDINELRTYKDPPKLVKTVLEAVAVLREFPTVYTPKPGNPKEVEANMWATAKRLLTQQNFMSGFATFDYNGIKLEVIEKVRKKYIGELNPSRLKDVSKAAHALCLWIRAIEEYDKAYRVVKPKEMRAREAKAGYEEKRENLKRIQEELQVLVQTLQAMQKDLDKKQEAKSELEDEIESCKVKIQRAKTLLEGLGGERARWASNIEEHKQSFETLEGDMLIASAVVTYLGPFPAKYRRPMVASWSCRCAQTGVSVRGNFSLEKLLGDSVLVNEWVLNGLPTDSFSRENGIIATQSCRWPLMIDPEGQANQWIKNQYHGMKLNVVKGVEDYLKVFRKAIPFGEPLLLEDIGTDIDSALDSVLQRQTFKQPGAVSIKLGDGTIDYGEGFLLFITTKLRWPHYLPEVSTRVAVIDFALTFDGLRDQVLDLVVQKERQELDEKRVRLIKQNHRYKCELRRCEAKILAVLSTSQGNILDDEAAVNAVKESQEAAARVKEKQQAALETEGRLESVREEYSPIAEHVACLYFVVPSLGKLNGMYQYSLSWYLALLARTIETAERSEYIEQRLEALKEQFTKLLYGSVVQSLFERDKLIFSFMIATCIGEYSDKLEAGCYKYLASSLALSGSEKKNPVDDWMPDNVWNALRGLAACSESLADLLNNICDNNKVWKEFYENITEAHTTNLEVDLPECIKNVTAFERLCLMKALAPERLLLDIKNYIRRVIGPEYLIHPPFDLEAAFKDSSASTPILFMLPGSDPLAALQSFAKAKGKADTMKIVSLGQDQGPTATRLIEEARKSGGWVMLQNCDLAPSFMPALERACDYFQARPGKDKLHRSFRLWLTSRPAETFPVSVLQRCVKLANEASESYKAGVLGAFFAAPVKELYSAGQAGFKRAVLSLCFFHALVQERRSFGPLGWNVLYDFNQSDMVTSARQMAGFWREESKEESTRLAKYLVGECNYGGRVTDERDRKLLATLADDFFSAKLSGNELPSGELSYEECCEHLVEKVPEEQTAELYGLHENAFITRNLKECGGFLSSMQQIGDSHLQNNKLKIVDYNQVSSLAKTEDYKEKVRQILSELPESVFDLELAAVRYPPLYENSMNAVLTQELSRFNTLLAVIKASLEQFLSALRGESVITSELEELSDSIVASKVPTQWRAKSYPSLKSLPAYLRDLGVRFRFFNDWLANGPPPIFWISGFFFTQAFLTGVLQDYARTRCMGIDDVAFDFDFLGEDPTDYDRAILDRSKTSLKAPESGAHISGLYLEGCRWDFGEKVLAESLPRVLFSKAPVIWLKPVANTRRREGYSCPMYRTAERRGTLNSTGHSTNYVMDIALPTKQPSAHWVKRGAAMISQLA